MKGTARGRARVQRLGTAAGPCSIVDEHCATASSAVEVSQLFIHSRIAWIVAGAVLVLAGLRITTALACEPNEHSIDRKLRGCTDRASSGGERKTCADEALDQWNAEMTRNYNRLMKKLGPDAQRRLASSQQTWIKYEEGERAYIDAMHAGLKSTTSGVDVVRARTDVVRRRAQELESHWNIIQLHEAPQGQ